jgi:hypothetical protein
MKVMWNGVEQVRVIRRGDLGISPDDDTELVWSADTRFVQDLSDKEYAQLQELTGPGTWAVVEESSDSLNDASSESAQPQEATESAKSSGKSAKA